MPSYRRGARLIRSVRRIKAVKYEPFLSLDSFIRMASDDVARANNDAIAGESQYHNRQFVRTAAAYVEAVVFAIRDAALAGAAVGTFQPSVGELAVLRGEAYEVDDKGEVVVRKHKLGVLKACRFAFAMYYRSIGHNRQLPVGEAGWSKLQTTFVVRDRLMHPKSEADLRVTDSEVHDIRVGVDWLTGYVKQAILVVADAYDSLAKRDQSTQVA
jgi:hypothetical protein